MILSDITAKKIRMKAIVYEGINQVDVREVKDPKIEKPDDAVIKITSTNLRL